MKKTLLALSAIAALALPASAETLGDMLRESGHEAIIGTWTDEASGSVTVTYAWSIENHAIALTVNMGDRLSKAIIGIDPETGDVVHNGYDNQGGSTTGRWDGSEDSAVLEATHIGADGEERSFVVTHVLADKDTLKVNMRSADASEGNDVTLVRKSG